MKLFNRNSRKDPPSRSSQFSLGQVVQFTNLGDTCAKRFNKISLYTPDDAYNPLAHVDEIAQQHAIYYYHTDLNAQPLDITDPSGQIVWSGEYTYWGKLRWQNPHYLMEQNKLISELQINLRYAGQYCDEETGLYYNTFRYYDPDTARFTTRDPIGLAGGLNLYAYAPNPVSWADPWGLSGDAIGSENNPFKTSRAARRDAMRQKGIPTSQQPVSQSKNASGREYRYNVTEPGGKGLASVQQQTMDRSHPDKPHWEAANVKLDDEGKPRMNKYGRPNIRNGNKRKAYYGVTGGCK